jgi:hypothetical protein
MERIYLPNKRLVKSRIITAYLSILIGFSLQLSAKESNQTLVLVGGALTTCASLSPKNCEIILRSRVKRIMYLRSLRLKLVK